MAAPARGWGAAMSRRRLAEVPVYADDGSRAKVDRRSAGCLSGAEASISYRRAVKLRKGRHGALNYAPSHSRKQMAVSTASSTVFLPERITKLLRINFAACLLLLGVAVGCKA